MNAPTEHFPRLKLRDLFIIITVFSMLLGAAAQYRNGLWMVLVPGSFYLPFFLLCTLSRSQRTLIPLAVVLREVVLRP